MSDEQKRKIGLANKGKIRSEEVRRKNSEKLKGKIPWNKGKTYKTHPRSKEIREKFSAIHKARVREGKCNFWKGGLTKLKLLIKDQLKYRLWRSDVFMRDEFTCKECGQRGGQLEVHHIKAYSLIMKENHILTLEQALNCEELWNLNNGKTLCRECHRKTDNYAKDLTLK